MHECSISSSSHWHTSHAPRVHQHLQRGGSKRSALSVRLAPCPAVQPQQRCAREADASLHAIGNDEWLQLLRTACCPAWLPGSGVKEAVKGWCAPKDAVLPELGLLVGTGHGGAPPRKRKCMGVTER